MQYKELEKLLNSKYEQFNNPEFIKDDPISVPHRFTRKQDIEIAGFFAAVFAWGLRKTIINKSLELMKLMDNSPFEFIKNHEDKDLKKIEKFKHRTFNSTDALYFIDFLKNHYSKNNSLENAFSAHMGKKDNTVENALIGFHNYFFEADYAPQRTRKHISTPMRNSACKRLNMYLRWMVRNDGKGVDFGIWKSIKPSQLVCPLDLHVERVARRFKLITRKQNDWKTAVELTDNLRNFDKFDPVKYDYSLFGLGVIEKK